MSSTDKTISLPAPGWVPQQIGLEPGLNASRNPEVGAYEQMRPDLEAVEQPERSGDKVEALPTADAVRRYGKLDFGHDLQPSSAAVDSRTTRRVASSMWRVPTTSLVII